MRLQLPPLPTSKKKNGLISVFHRVYMYMYIYSIDTQNMLLYFSCWSFFKNRNITLMVLLLSMNHEYIFSGWCISVQKSGCKSLLVAGKRHRHKECYFIKILNINMVWILSNYDHYQESQLYPILFNVYYFSISILFGQREWHTMI